ncbi:MAG: iron-sulfur cluster assembly accessory protein [Candidatus Thalassarchaeaceae archaeon]|jgi:iron-sulfur cluster assembly protein|nr:iron-sulfur cluster assembly accessory protein [Candidatus Thalassarchaeaceae archaeon]
MSDEDCGSTFVLPVAEGADIVPVTIDVTDSAMEAMQGAMSNSGADDVLVVSVLGGGCSGFMYDLQIQNRPTEDGWQFITCENITIAVHDSDSVKLSGITLDFVNSLMGGGFKVVNPNAEKSCGCGKSFR